MRPRSSSFPVSRWECLPEALPRVCIGSQSLPVDYSAGAWAPERLMCSREVR